MAATKNRVKLDNDSDIQDVISCLAVQIFSFSGHVPLFVKTGGLSQPQGQTTSASTNLALLEVWNSVNVDVTA